MKRDVHITQLLGEEDTRTPDQIRLGEQAKQKAAKKRARKGEKWKAFVEARDGGVVVV